MIGVTAFAKRDYLVRYPISTVVMIGYVGCYFLLPPVATIVSGVPLTNNLDHPVLVMVNAVACLLALLAAHTIYRRSSLLSYLRLVITKKLYKPLHFFEAPSNVQLLLMGLIGLAATAYEILALGAFRQAHLGIKDRLIQGFYPAAYLPLVAVVRETVGGKRERDNKWYWIILSYIVLMVYVLLGSNSRFALLGIFASIGLVYLYGIAAGIYKADAALLRRTGLAVAAALILSGPITDLAMTMVVVRNERGAESPLALVASTLRAYENKNTVSRYKSLASGLGTVYDEYYTGNLFFDRLCNLKYADNSITLAKSLSKPAKTAFETEQLDRVLSELPAPFIHIIGIDVNKASAISKSAGDFLLYEATGMHGVLGTFYTGSLFGSGYALFGWWYPLFFAIIAFFVFALSDALTISRLSKRGYRIPVLSPIVVVSFFTWCFLFTSAASGNDSLAGVAGYLVRGWLQVAFVYGIIYWLTYWPSRWLHGRKTEAK